MNKLGISTSKGFHEGKILLFNADGVQINKSQTSYSHNLGDKELAVGDTLEIEVEKIVYIQTNFTTTALSYGCQPYRIKVRSSGAESLNDVGDLTIYYKGNYASILISHYKTGENPNRIVFQMFESDIDNFGIRIHKVYRIVE